MNESNWDASGNMWVSSSGNIMTKINLVMLDPENTDMMILLAGTSESGRT